MDSIFKIECNGDFREGRALALLSSMVTHNIQNIDMAIISSDGITIPTNSIVTITTLAAARDRSGGRRRRTVLEARAYVTTNTFRPRRAGRSFAV